ncbi:DUF4231 domain-containing protein [Roseburia hominis]
MGKSKNTYEEELYFMKGHESTEEEYFEVVNNYIRYYARRAKRCKYQYYGFNIIKFIALAAIPIIQMIDVTADRPWIAAMASSICLLVESIMGMWRTREKWIIYRDTYNQLGREQRIYATGSGKYAEKEKRFHKFVMNIEALISDEARKWCEVVREKEKDIHESK